jgi:hypothetical protein
MNESGAMQYKEDTKQNNIERCDLHISYYPEFF